LPPPPSVPKASLGGAAAKTGISRVPPLFCGIVSSHNLQGRLPRSVPLLEPGLFFFSPLGHPLMLFHNQFLLPPFHAFFSLESTSVLCLLVHRHLLHTILGFHKFPIFSSHTRAESLLIEGHACHAHALPNSDSPSLCACSLPIRAASVRWCYPTRQSPPTVSVAPPLLFFFLFFSQALPDERSYSVSYGLSTSSSPA